MRVSQLTQGPNLPDLQVFLGVLVDGIFDPLQTGLSDWSSSARLVGRLAPERNARMKATLVRP
jgi:hypothetical protein